MHVKKALAENYFYSLDLETGREPLGETFLANQVDTPGCDAIRRMFDERQPLGDHATRAALSIFLAFQHVRGRTTREALVEYTKLSMRVLGSFATPALVLERARAATVSPARSYGPSLQRAPLARADGACCSCVANPASPSSPHSRSISALGIRTHLPSGRRGRARVRPASEGGAG